MEKPARHGEWIQTASGRQFWPLDPRPEDVEIEDIAHALSNICRFTGHCAHFYSVAQHSVLVAANVPSDIAIWGLLHDAAEAYIGDISRPLKRSLFARLMWKDGEAGMGPVKSAEKTILEAVAVRYGIRLLTDWDSIEKADMLLLATEARDLMEPLHPEWHHKESNGWAVLPERITPWNPDRARAVFLNTFHALTGGALPLDQSGASDWWESNIQDTPSAQQTT